MPEIIDQRASNCGKQWEQKFDTRLWPHDVYSTRTPVHVIKLEVNGLTPAKSVNAHHQEQGIIALSSRASAIDSIEDPLHVCPR